MLCQSLHERCFGGFQIAGPPLSQTEVDEGLQPVRTAADAIAERLDATCIVATHQPEVTQAEPGILPLRFTFHHFLQALLRFFALTPTLTYTTELPHPSPTTYP